VIVDEIHERDLNSDFLLIILRELIEKRKDVRLVLMSATLNASLFSQYFFNCPIIEIPGMILSFWKYSFLLKKQKKDSRFL